MILPLITRRRIFGCFATPVVAALTVGLVGCASTPAPENEREALLQRAGAFWKTVQDGDSVASWKYEEVSKLDSASLFEARRHYLRGRAGTRCPLAGGRPGRGQCQDHLFGASAAHEQPRSAFAGRVGTAGGTLVSR